MIRIFALLCAIPLLSYELAIAAIFRDEAPILKEWIEYHRLVGVEHFWLYNDRSQDNWQETLAPYIAEGEVEVIEWDTREPVHYIGEQVAAYRDAIQRASGKARWLALIDLDEFILPTQEASAVDVLNRHFASSAAVYVNWRNFGTGGVSLEPGEPILNRLFCASKAGHPRNSCGKSIVRPEKVTEIWNPHHMVIPQGETYSYADGKPIPHEWDLQVDGLRHEGHLVLNHYTFRDENYFQKVRIPRARAWGIEPWLVRQLYDDYNEEYDFSILRFLKTHNAERYSQIWDARRPGIQVELNAPSLGGRLFQAASGCAIAWNEGTEPCFSGIEPDSEDFRSFLFRTCPAPMQGRALQPVSSASSSWRLFSGHRERLLKLFAPHPNDVNRIKELFYWIEDNPDTVGVYLSPDLDPEFSKEYLKKSVLFFPEDALFVVCCSDPEAAKASFPEGYDNVFFVRGQTDAIVLRILNLCANQIIDSSSLGWWGAWLSPRPDKTVICPNPGDYPPDWFQVHISSE